MIYHTTGFYRVIICFMKMVSKLIVETIFPHNVLFEKWNKISKVLWASVEIKGIFPLRISCENSVLYS